MQVSAEEHKRIQTDLGRHIQQKTNKNKETNTRIFNEYTRLIAEPGASEESVYAELRGRFGCTNRRLNMARSNHLKNISPKAQVISEASLIVAVGKMVASHEMLKMAYEQELERVQRSEHKWVDTDQTETDGGKFSATTTKRVSAKQYILQMEEKIAALPERALDHISRLLTKNVININTAGDLSQQSFTDLDKEEKLLMDRLKVMKEAEVVES